MNVETTLYWMPGNATDSLSFYYPTYEETILLEVAQIHPWIQGMCCAPSTRQQGLDLQATDILSG